MGQSWRQAPAKLALRILCVAALLASPIVFLSVNALATDGGDSGAVGYGEEVLGPQKHATGLTSLGPDLFGEQINTNTGGISFSQTDLSVPGNNALPVNVTRRLIVDGNKSPSFDGDVNLWRGYPFGEWELDLPYLGGMYTEDNGWEVFTSNRTARCSSPTKFSEYRPYDAAPNLGTNISSYSFWHGLQLNIPGQGEQEVLYNESPNPTSPSGLATAGGWTALTTKNQWHFACLTALQPGKTGEGFLALAPDGTRYWFNWMVSYADRPIHGTGFIDIGGGAPPRRVYADVNRRAYRLYPTRIEDRFGNYVTYSYETLPSDGLKLNRIQSSDGRLITFDYYPGGKIAKATAGDPATSKQYVNYTYTGDGLLSEATLADDSKWTYSTSAIVNLARFVPLTDPNAFDVPFPCQQMRRLTGDRGDLIMTSPSGAQGVFRLQYNRLFRTNIAGATVMCPGLSEDGPHSWRDFQGGVRSRALRRIGVAAKNTVRARLDSADLAASA